jgi:hypothetical protein
MFMKQKHNLTFSFSEISTVLARRLLVLLTFLTVFSMNHIFCQLLTEKSELKRQFSQFSFFPNNPCEIQNEVQWNGKNKVVHFVRFESCHFDKTKLKGIVYGVLVVDDTLYNVSLETASLLFFKNEDFLKNYKKLDKTQKTILENTNLQLNLDHYEKIREEIRKLEEKKRAEEEEKRRVEEEKKRLEEERLAKIRAQELANGLKKAASDSVVNDELRPKLAVFSQNLKSQDSIVDLRIKTGINNGGILITQFSFSTSTYGVVDLTLGIQNVGKKRIKYATFILQPYNSVDDPVEYEKSFKGIGFIEPNSDGVWNFESAWFSDVIQTLKLKSVNLVFEDGSSKLITKIGEIRIDDSSESLKDAITNKQKKVLHQMGSLVLLEYQETEVPIVGFCMYSVLDKDLKAKIYQEEEARQIITDLSDIIFNLKNNIVGKQGIFEITKYSSLIYLYTDGGYCLLDIKDAEKILSKLTQLFPG